MGGREDEDREGLRSRGTTGAISDEAQLFGGARTGSQSSALPDVCRGRPGKGGRGWRVVIRRPPPAEDGPRRALARPAPPTAVTCTATPRGTRTRATHCRARWLKRPGRKRSFFFSAFTCQSWQSSGSPASLVARPPRSSASAALRH